MEYYAIYDAEHNELSKSNCPVLNMETIEITKEVFDNFEKYMYQDGEIVFNPNWEEEQKEKEQERIDKLKMTALDFIGVLKSFGLTSIQIKSYLDDHLEIDEQLKYCGHVFCGVAKSFMPITYEGKTITKEMVEQAFIAKGVNK